MQLWNIGPILVTLDVSKPETSKDVKLEQPKNIAPIFVTPEVSAVPPSNAVMLEQPKKALFSAAHPTSPRSTTSSTSSRSPPLLK